MNDTIEHFLSSQVCLRKKSKLHDTENRARGTYVNKKQDRTKLCSRNSSPPNNWDFFIRKLDVDPRREDDASPMSSFGYMLRPTYLFMDRMITPIIVHRIS